MKLLLIILLMFSGCMTEKKLAKYLDKNGYMKLQYGEFHGITNDWIIDPGFSITFPVYKYPVDTFAYHPVIRTPMPPCKGDSLIIGNLSGKLNIDTLTTKK